MSQKKAKELLKKIISECDEMEKDHPFPNEPLIHNRPCYRCNGREWCFVIEAIEALAELKKQPDLNVENAEIDDCILAFAKRMQYKLDKNKHKGCAVMNPKGKGRGWQDCDILWLYKRLIEEASELRDSLQFNIRDSFQFNRGVESILDESADVANFAMMIFDNTLRVKKQAGKRRFICICKHRKTGEFSARYNDGERELWWTGKGWAKNEKEVFGTENKEQLSNLPLPIIAELEKQPDLEAENKELKELLTAENWIPKKWMDKTVAENEQLKKEVEEQAALEIIHTEQIDSMAAEIEQLKKENEDLQDIIICLKAKTEEGNPVPWDKLKKDLNLTVISGPQKIKGSDDS